MPQEHRRLRELRRAIAGGHEEIAEIVGPISYRRGRGYDVQISQNWVGVSVQGYQHGSHPELFVRTNIFDSRFTDMPQFGDMSLQHHQRWVALYRAAPEFMARPLGLLREKGTGNFLGSIVENVPGYSLAEFIEKHSVAKDADPVVVESLITQLERFVSLIQAKGLEHGDLYGSNIRITPNNRIKIIDPRAYQDGRASDQTFLREHVKALRAVAKTG
jgi:hypothetical protein